MIRAIDHLVIATPDLDGTASLYESLGFTVGIRNRHPWGTHNRLVQFPGCFLELITLAEPDLVPEPQPGIFSFGAFVRDALERGDTGLVMLALRSADASADAAAFTEAGIGGYRPFSFERLGRDPSGAEATVGFTLGFARDEGLPDMGFFVCQQLAPHAFWNPTLQRHANGATGIAAVSLVVDNPTDHHIFLTAFTGQRDLAATSTGIAAELGNGRLDYLFPPAAGYFYGTAEPGTGRFCGFAIQVPDHRAMAQRLDEVGLPCIAGASRTILPAHVGGTAIAFVDG